MNKMIMIRLIPRFIGFVVLVLVALPSTAAVTRSLHALAGGRVRAVVSWSFDDASPSGLILEEQFPSGWTVETIDLGTTPGFVRRGTTGWAAAMGATAAGSVEYTLQSQSPSASTVLVGGSSKRMAEGHLVQVQTGGDQSATLSSSDSAKQVIRITRWDPNANGKFWFGSDNAMTGTVYLESCDLSSGMLAGWTCIWTSAANQRIDSIQTNCIVPQVVTPRSGSMFRLRVQSE